MRTRRSVSFPLRLTPGLRLVRTIPLLALCAFVTCSWENVREIAVSYYEIKENINNLCGNKIIIFAVKRGDNTHGASFLNRARNSRCTVITDLDTSKRSTQKVFSCCDAILETGPAVSMRSELLVAHEKLGQLPLLTVYVVPV